MSSKKMYRLRSVLCGVFMLTILLAPLPRSTAAHAQVAPIPPLLITPEIPPRDVVERGEVFFDQTFDFSAGEGRIVIASTPDGKGQVFVDDEIEVIVSRHDHSRAFVRNYEFQPPSEPLDLSGYFRPGTNRVRVVLRDTFGGGIDSTALYLVNIGVQDPATVVAGTGIHFIDAPSGFCTNGPAVTRPSPSGPIRLHLTARHCVDRGQFPLMVELQSDSSEVGGPIHTCSIDSPTCTRNGSKAREKTDVIAWRPTVPVSNKLLTGPSTYRPVVGSVSVGRFKDVRAGDTLCAYGNKSEQQRCGPVLTQKGLKINKNGLVVAEFCTLAGDSGGPVYVHTDGDAGVKIAGIIQGSTTPETCTEDSQTQVLTFDKAAKLLDVDLLTTP